MSKLGKYDFEQAWLLLIEAERLRRHADLIEIGFEQAGKSISGPHEAEVKRIRSVVAELRRTARRLLREMGYEPDCEIGPELEELVLKATDDVEAVQWCIASNSPKLARESLRLGVTYISDWQDANPSPVRPTRKK